MGKQKKKYKILIIRLSALGDIVHSFPALRHINENLQASQLDYSIDFLIYEKFRDLLIDLNFINQIHTLKDKKLSTLISIFQNLIKEKYDYVIDFQGLIKTGFISFASLANHRVGFKEPREKLASLFYDRPLKAHSIWDENFHVVEHNLKLADFFLKEFFFQELFQGKIPQPYQKKMLIRSTKNIPLRKIVIIPCTTWETKFWPISHWVDLIEKLSINFPNARFYFTGTPSERKYIESISEQLLPNTYLKCSNILDKGLIGLRIFFKDVDLVIGVDTGPLHLAADVLYFSDTAKILGLYGPSSGRRSGPYSFDYLSHDELFNQKATYKRKFKKAVTNTLAEIKAETVFEKILTYSFS